MSREGFLCVAHLDCALKTSFGNVSNVSLNAAILGAFACLPFLLVLKSREVECTPSVPVIVTSCHTLVPGSFINVSSYQPYGPRLTRGHGGVYQVCNKTQTTRRKRC